MNNPLPVIFGGLDMWFYGITDSMWLWVDRRITNIINQLKEHTTAYFVTILILVCVCFIMVCNIKYLKDLSRRINKHDCNLGEHIWSHHTLGRYCIYCKLTKKDYLKDKDVHK